MRQSRGQFYRQSGDPYQYRVKSGGHPSDVIAPVLAVGDALRANGASVINAMALAYEIYCSFCEAVGIKSKGWDQPVFAVIASAIGAAKLLGLNREQMANDPTRWSPKTHERADHSLPYVVAVALLDGAVASKSFTDDRLRDPAIADLMQKVKVSEDRGLSASYPEAAPCRLRVHIATGEVFAVEVMYPKGHAKNPLSDADMETKFRSLVPRNRLDDDRCQAILTTLWGFEHVTNVRDLMELFVLPSE